MALPYVGEIRMFAGNFAPAGWMFCDGQLLAISENEVLFQVIGTTYGGDGMNTFALPNLASRLPVHFGTGPTGETYQMGETGGVESVTLTVNQIPGHTHIPRGASAGSSDSPANHFWATSALGKPFVPVNPPPAGATVQMNTNTMGFTGGSQPHDNMHPFLCLNYIISLFGLFPSQT